MIFDPYAKNVSDIRQHTLATKTINNWIFVNLILALFLYWSVVTHFWGKSYCYQQHIPHKHSHPAPSIPSLWLHGPPSPRSSRSQTSDQQVALIKQGEITIDVDIMKRWMNSYCTEYFNAYWPQKWWMCNLENKIKFFGKL